MPLCKLGCDELYEKDFLQVQEEGTITKNEFKNYSDNLNKFLEKYEGKKCKHFNDKTKRYFAEKIELSTEKL
tara:strand:- start:21 stop:236 length:216 start_codon:yes stop_codon:yes gene_type:complete